MMSFIPIFPSPMSPEGLPTTRFIGEINTRNSSGMTPSVPEFERPFTSSVDPFPYQRYRKPYSIDLENECERLQLRYACCSKSFEDLKNIDFLSLGCVYGFGDRLLVPKADKTFESWAVSPNFGCPALPLIVEARPASDLNAEPFLHVDQPFHNGLCTIINKVDGGPLTEFLVARPLPSIEDISKIPLLPKHISDATDQFLNLDTISGGIVHVKKTNNQAAMRAINSFIAYRAYHSNEVPMDQQKFKSTVLKSMWQAEPVDIKSKWTRIAKIFTFARRQNVMGLDFKQFLRRASIIFKLPDPKDHVASFQEVNSHVDWTNPDVVLDFQGRSFWTAKKV